MCPLLVVGEERGGRAPVRASLAQERLLSSVDPSVVVQVCFLPKLLATCIAEELFSSFLMDNTVFSQVFCGVKLLLTSGAFKLTI